ncbi:MAG: hypothetical protein ACPGVZ_17885 [Myxococcota bacterium]
MAPRVGLLDDPMRERRRIDPHGPLLTALRGERISRVMLALQSPKKDL